MCSVVRCDSSRRSVRLYAIPEDPEKRLQWVQFVLQVNEQRLKESSCADISICGEHFTHDCFEYAGGFAQLKPSAVPSVCVKAEPEEPEIHIKVEEVDHIMLVEPGEAHVKAENPEPDHIMLVEPDEAHVKAENPEPDHIMLVEPDEAHVKAEHPEPDHIMLVEPDEAHVKAENPEPDHVKIEPVHVKVEEIQAEHGNPPEPEHVHLESVEPEELMISSDSDCDRFEPCSPSSIDIPGSPVSSDASEVSAFDYDQMLQKIENIDMIKKKVALLRMKRKYVVNESRLLQLFSSECPLCGSKVKVEKVKFDLFIAIDLQCLECEYGKHWESQTNTPAPTAEDQDILEEGDVMDETEESSVEDDTDSGDDWVPTDEVLVEELLQTDSDADSGDGERIESLSQRRQLCLDCGKFYIKEPHTCVHKVKPYSCNICGKRFANEPALASHSRVHSEGYLHPCKYCHTEFKSNGDKVAHEQTHLTEHKPYRCSDCSEVFATHLKRRVHMKTHKDTKKKCHDKVLVEELLQTDSDTDGGGERIESLSQRRRLCVDCGKFYNKDPHTCVHKVKPYSCNICGKRFAKEATSVSHSRVHTEGYLHQCKYCHTEFKTNGDKVAHEQTHLTEHKPYRCSDCSEVFATHLKRRVHMKTHKDTKKKCHVCGMILKDIHHLNSHLEVHTGLMPIECPVCQRNFSQEGHLKSHMLLHTGERPFKCPHCDDVFTLNVSLKSHVLRCHTSKQRCDNSASEIIDSQNVSKSGAGPGLHDIERAKVKRQRKKSPIRPKGRPKKAPVDQAGENGDRGSRKSKVRKLNRTQLMDEESEDELTEGMNTSSESSEEEGTVTLNASKSKGKRKQSDIDTDFVPKKKGKINQNNGQNSGKRQRRKTNKNQDT